MFSFLSFTFVSHTSEDIAHPFHVHFRFRYFFKAFHFYFTICKHTLKLKFHGLLHYTCLHKRLTHLKKQSHYIKNVTLFTI
mmetsp:Transcript_13674/g.43180  ORF Transcript_13674/g.43180 Transcript_13674/m.43180 type:complete len:81 (+) Transcript_13674:96-338(+)